MRAALSVEDLSRHPLLSPPASFREASSSIYFACDFFDFSLDFGCDGGAALFTLNDIVTFTDGDGRCGDRQKNHAQDQVHLWLRNTFEIQKNEKKIKIEKKNERKKNL